MDTQTYIIECQIDKYEKAATKHEAICTVEASTPREAILLGMEQLKQTIKNATQHGSDIVVGNEHPPMTRYHHFIAKRECFKDYPTPMLTNDYIDYHEKYLISHLKEIGISAEQTAYGVRYKTGIDSWVADIRDANADDAYVILYHQNLIEKGGNSKIPDHHVQYSKRVTMDDLIFYTTNHQKAYNKANKSKK